MVSEVMWIRFWVEVYKIYFVPTLYLIKPNFTKDISYELHFSILHLSVDGFCLSVLSFALPSIFLSLHVKHGRIKA